MPDSPDPIPGGDSPEWPHFPYQGLTDEQVRIQRQKFGANVLTPPPEEPWWRLYLEKFQDPVIRILLLAALIALGVGAIRGEYGEGLGIVVAILLATGLGFANEYRAYQEFSLLNHVYDQVTVKAIRNGKFEAIPRPELVVGDMVFVEQGEEVPADGRILEATALYVDEAKLTGESEPMGKYAGGQWHTDQEDTYGTHFLYRSTLVTQGHGMFQVTAVGDHSEIGRLAQALSGIDTSGQTPLNQQLERLSHGIGVVGFSVSVLTFLALLVRAIADRHLPLSWSQGYGLLLVMGGLTIAFHRLWWPVFLDGLGLLGIHWRGWRWGDRLGNWLGLTTLALMFVGGGLALGGILGWVPREEGWLPPGAGLLLLNHFMVAVTIVVVAVPEGLPMSVTLSLAYSMRRMAATHNLVRRLHACETIGAATVICSDKTGTLTCNQMRVEHFCFPGWQRDPLRIAEAIAVNSTADLEKRPQEGTTVIGNVTEGALLLWLDQEDINYIQHRNHFQVREQLAFSGDRKYMATWGNSPHGKRGVMYLKGAPEVVLGVCDRQMTAEGVMLLPPAIREQWLGEIAQYQHKGLRILALAHGDLPPSDFDPSQPLEQRFIWLGYAVLSDPLRPRVAEAVAHCRGAGIQVKIVTGDSPITAQEIARQIGLWNEMEDGGNPYVHLTGQAFQLMDDEEALRAVRSLKILSRACPLDKLRLVRLLQHQGEVVAVTGDGTNDAAALKQAQVGLSMGSGTAIAKEASDIVLLDDSFHSIVNAIIWGRSLYDNIQRFILFQLTINGVALGIALLGPFLGVELPLTVTQMLWVNLIMDTFAALALATEPPHREVLNRPPRMAQAFIISPAMAQTILIVGLVFLGFLVAFLRHLQRDGAISTYELSVFFAVFVLLQFWNLFNARCFGRCQSAASQLKKNPTFSVIALAILVGQILIVQYGGKVFRTVPLSLGDWCWILLGTSAVLWIGEFVRAWQRWRGPSAPSRRSSLLNS